MKIILDLVFNDKSNLHVKFENSPELILYTVSPKTKLKVGLNFSQKWAKLNKKCKPAVAHEIIVVKSSKALLHKL